MNAPGSKIGTETETHRGTLRWAGQMIAAWILFGAILFLSAGRLPAGWIG